MPETAWYVIAKYVGIYTSIFNQNTYIIRLEQMNYDATMHYIEEHGGQSLACIMS